MQYESTTTLRRIRDAQPCRDGWVKLLDHLDKTAADDEPLDLLTILNSNGLSDALWVLTYAMPDDRLARHFQAWCAEQVLHLFESARPGDTRVRDQIATLRDDSASPSERMAAKNAARAAVMAARAAAADVAARASVRAAARAAELAAYAAANTSALASADAAADAAAEFAADAAVMVAAAASPADRAGAWSSAYASARAYQERQLRLMLEARA